MWCIKSWYQFWLKKRVGLFSFEYNLLPNLISNFNHYMDRAKRCQRKFRWKKWGSSDGKSFSYQMANKFHIYTWIFWRFWGLSLEKMLLKLVPFCQKKSTFCHFMFCQTRKNHFRIWRRWLISDLYCVECSQNKRTTWRTFFQYLSTPKNLCTYMVE